MADDLKGELDAELATSPPPPSSPPKTGTGLTIRRNRSGQETANTDDLAELEVLTDDILCECLMERYQHDKIYTYVGNILIAVNPFQWLGLYTDEMSAQYTNVHNKAEHPPHLFVIADSAYHSMMRNKKPQVCVISGESGAGKTESAKQFIRQIMDVSARGVMGGSSDSSAGRARHPVENKIQQQNPILEAFGNAKTVMNDNSSRFGKFIELKFNDKNMVSGAHMSHYLLEKARIVMQGPGEGNYHIFGQMFAGMDDATKAMYRLAAYETYRYLPADMGDISRLTADWKELQEAFRFCGFGDMEVDQLQSVLSAVLAYGNIDFEDGDQGDAAVIANNETFDVVCNALMVQPEKLRAALMTHVIEMRGEKITKHLNVKKCINARNATAKALYDRLFKWLVYKLNQTLEPEDDDGIGTLSIGILDIFGFENFKKNGFDQMCINLANEQLHMFFNQHIFAEEIGSYADEGLELSSDIMFSDNKAVINMFFRKPPARPVGLLAILDEESGFERATATSLLDKFNKHLADEPLYVTVKGNYAFEVMHYAGKIRYETDGFLEKNTDPLPSLMANTMQNCRNDVCSLSWTPGFDVETTNKAKFGNLYMTKKNKALAGKSMRNGPQRNPTLSKNQAQALKDLKMSMKKSMKMNGQKQKKEVQTVSASFRQSLGLLMLKMNMCEPHFVRCIKPNPAKKPHIWDKDLVLRQLTYTGMLQTVQMRREGYPFRIPFVDFFNAYHGIVFDFSAPMKGNAQTCKELLTALEAKVEQERAAKGLQTITSTLRGWLVAKTVVFLKYWQLDLLDGMAHPFGVAAIRIQKLYRGHMARKRFEPLKQKYVDDCAAAATLITEIFRRSERLCGALETLMEEETRRGLIDLGVEKPPEVDLKKFEKEKVKAEKKAVKAQAKGGNAQVDQKKFEKDLSKIKSKVVRWWIKYERNKGCHVDEEGTIYPWFHGLISRVEAEDYLFDQDTGAFLIRVSERVNGYAISFRYSHRIRHYKLGFSPNGGYEISGCSEDFGTLIELIEHYQVSPITPGEQDILGEPVQFEHDLGLGIDVADGIVGKRPPRMTTDERKAKAQSLSAMNFLDDESGGVPMKDEMFLENVDPKPRWLRGKISRVDAEEELRDRGMVDGRFIVREKLRSSERIVLALSVTFRRKFYHHLLARQVEGQWLLDEKSLDYTDKLEEVITYLQKKKSPKLAGMLEAEPYNPPEANHGPVPDSVQGQRQGTLLVEKQHSQNLVPGDSSSVDDVVAWLASLGMARYAGAFYKAKMNGAKLHKANEKQLRKLVKSEDDYRLVVRALR